MPHPCGAATWKWPNFQVRASLGWQAHLCPHLFAMVYEGELAAVWGHIFVQSGRAGDPAEACPTMDRPGNEPGQAQFALKPSWALTLASSLRKRRFWG